MQGLLLTGGILFALALVLWVWGRARLQRSVFTGLNCPNCGGHRFVRVHRRLSERLLGLRVRRLRCLDCRWEGLYKRNG
jgi:hypothetical protein